MQITNLSLLTTFFWVLTAAVQFFFIKDDQEIYQEAMNTDTEDDIPLEEIEERLKKQNEFFQKLRSALFVIALLTLILRLYGFKNLQTIPIQ